MQTVVTVAAAPGQLTLKGDPKFLVLPGGKMWDTELLRTKLPGAILQDDRPGAPPNNVFWEGNLSEAGQFHYGYVSGWLPESLRFTDGVPSSDLPAGVVETLPAFLTVGEDAQSQQAAE